MFCQKCGTPVPEETGVCPNCTPAPSAPPKKTSRFGFNAPSKGGKSFAAIFSAITLIPTIGILTIDYIWNYAIDWPATGYLVGALLVIWICSVLPAVRVTPAPVTAFICFMSAALYIMYIVKRLTDSMEWFTVFALPALMIPAVFIGLDSSLASSTRLRGFGMGALVSAEAAIYSIAWGILWDNYYHAGVIELRFSVICASLFLMQAVILAAVAYVQRVNRK